jgi:O-antigen/teichoic acid export membrane protein
MKTAITIIKNSIANYSRTIYRVGIGFVTIGILARYLNPDTFGQYAYIVALIAIFKLMPGMGVSVILAREIARDKEKAPFLFASALVLQSVLSIITFVIIGIIFYFIAPSKEVFYAAIICATAMIIENWKMLFSSIYQAFEKMAFDTIQTFITETLYLISLVVITRMDLGFLAIFWTLLLAESGGAVFGSIVIIKRFIWPQFERVSSLCRFLFKEAFPIGIKGILRKLNFRIDTLILAALKSNVEVGIFHGSYKIVQNLTFITDAAAQAMFPVFSRYGVSSKTSLDLAYQKSLKFVLLIAIPIAIFLSYYSKPVITLVLGHKYIESANVLQILGWALALMFITNLMEKMLIAGNKQYLTTITIFISLGVNILLDLLLIPKMSYIGASIATLFSEIVVLSLSFYFISESLGFSIDIRSTLKLLFAGLLTYAFLWLFKDINVLIGGLVEILIYVAILIAIRTFSEDEIYLFKQLLRGIFHVKPMNV